MSEEVTIELENLRCTPAGLSALGVFASSVERHRGKKIIIDCSFLRLFDANITAAFGAIKSRAKFLGSELSFRNLRTGVTKVLNRNGFFPGGDPSSYDTCIPLKKFGLDEAKVFADYTSLEFSHQDIPIMSDGLRVKFFEGIDELFNNAVIHSKTSTGVFACGQAYPRKKRLEFSIVDLGIGFKRNVESYLNREISATDAIAWAMEENNTTRSLDIPGGLGLKILKDFVELNGGTLIVYSDHGYWSLSSAGIIMKELRGLFPGTFVNVEINTADQNIYLLDNEIDPNIAL